MVCDCDNNSVIIKQLKYIFLWVGFLVRSKNYYSLLKLYISGHLVKRVFLYKVISTMLKVMHVITGLGSGGAETALMRLLSGIDKDKFESLVVSMTDRGAVATDIESHNVKVFSLGLSKNPLSLFYILRLFYLIHKFKPDILQAWMYHSNIVVWFVSLMMMRKYPVFWNIRHSLDGTQTDKRLTRWLIKFGASLSGKVIKVIYNSHVSLKQHVDIGYASHNAVVIANGFDCDFYKPDDSAKTTLCESLGVSSVSKIVGTVGRFHPIKDHENLINSFALLSKKYPDSELVLIGKNLTPENINLVNLVRKLDIGDHVHFLGERNDVARLVAGFDLFALSSLGEAFPNVVGEAMACAVPCVSTNVGDAAQIIGDTGLIVPTADSEAMAAAFIDLMSKSGDELCQLGALARERIQSEYTLEASIKKYEYLYHSVAH